jgi:hypothetical protein
MSPEVGQTSRLRRRLLGAALVAVAIVAAWLLLDFGLRPRTELWVIRDEDGRPDFTLYAAPGEPSSDDSWSLFYPDGDPAHVHLHGVEPLETLGQWRSRLRHDVLGHPRCVEYRVTTDVRSENGRRWVKVVRN